MDTNSLIKVHRERANLSQAELGRRIGVSRSAVCKWESGDRLPDLRYWAALVKEIGIPVSDIAPGLADVIGHGVAQ